MTRPCSRHLNGKQLAAALGKNQGYVTAMKFEGYRFEFASTTTLEHAEAWLRAHPDFRSTNYVAKHSRQKAAAAN